MKTLDYPLGGSLEPYDIERERQILNDFEWSMIMEDEEELNSFEEDDEGEKNKDDEDEL